MKLKNMQMTAVLALVGTAFIETSASAQSASTGDLILGFRINDSTTPGNTTNLEVDLGAYTNYTNLEGTGTVEQLNVGAGNYVGVNGAGGLSVTDLQNAFGNGTSNPLWNTRSDLIWGVAGSRGSPSNETFLTSTSTLFDNTTLGVAVPVTALYNGFGNVTLTGNSTTAGTIATSTAGGWTYQVTNNGGNAAGNDFATGLNLEQGVSSTGTETLNLYDLTKHPSTTAATLVGTFNLASNGTFTFDATPAAVPEPSAYALGICAMLLFLVLKRRSAIKA